MRVVGSSRSHSSRRASRGVGRRPSRGELDPVVQADEADPLIHQLSHRFQAVAEDHRMPVTAVHVEDDRLGPFRRRARPSASPLRRRPGRSRDLLETLDEQLRPRVELVRPGRVARRARDQDDLGVRGLRGSTWRQPAPDRRARTNRTASSYVGPRGGSKNVRVVQVGADEKHLPSRGGQVSRSQRV